MSQHLQLKITDQDSKQVVGEAREAIHIRINNPVLNHNVGKMHMSEIFKPPPWNKQILQMRLTKW